MAALAETNRWYDLRRRGETEGLRQYKQERIEEIARIRRALSRLGKEEVSKSEKYFPIRFFSDGAEAYIELFDNASVWYSSLSVELALTVRLGAEIDRWVIRSRRPSFNQLIEYAPDDLLSPRMKGTAHEVRRLRNCYIHYYNIMYDQQIRDSQSLMELLTKMEQEIGAAGMRSLLIVEGLNMSGADEHLNILRKRAIPVVERLVDPDMKRFISKRYDKYLKWLSRGKLPESLQGAPLHIVFELYGIERFDALSCLNSSFQVLRHLKFV